MLHLRKENSLFLYFEQILIFKRFYSDFDFKKKTLTWLKQIQFKTSKTILLNVENQNKIFRTLCQNVPMIEYNPRAGWMAKKLHISSLYAS